MIWLELSCQGIKFDVIVSGCPTSLVTQTITQDYKYPTYMKTIIHTSLMASALGSILRTMENVLGKSRNESGKVIPLTGDDGLKMKVFTMHAFARNIADDFDQSIDGDNRITSLLPNLMIILAMKAADCGVSSHYCQNSYQNGIVPSIYSIVQEMRRVNQNPVDDPGNNKCAVHVSFTCLAELYLRIMQQPNPAEQGLQLKAMMEVIQLFLIPRKCQHIIFKCYFKDPASAWENSPCQTKCTCCISGVKSLTMRINCSRTRDLLISFCTG